MGSRRVLLVAAALHMVTETALAPFYPALFRTAFGIDDLSATGNFIVLTRIAAIIAIPLWGLATRRWPMERLVLIGQTAAVVLSASLAMAPTYAVFTAIGIALVAVKSVVLLAYPRTARTHPTGLLPGVRQYVAVLQVATVAACGLGILIVSVPDPMTALPLLAVAEVGLLAVCVLALRGRTGDELVEPVTASTVPNMPSRALAPLAVLVLGFAFAGAVVRPYFTEYTAAAGMSELTGALLFVVAHLASLVAVTRTPMAPPGLVVPFAIAAIGLGLQAVTGDPLLLMLARSLFGVGLGLGQVALDVRVLAATGGSGAAYGPVAAAQHTGLLSAPLVATAGATWDLAVPLATGAGLFALLAIISVPVLNTAIPTRPRTPEVSDVPVRTP